MPVSPVGAPGIEHGALLVPPAAMTSISARLAWSPSTCENQHPHGPGGHIGKGHVGAAVGDRPARRLGHTNGGAQGRRRAGPRSADGADRARPVEPYGAHRDRHRKCQLHPLPRRSLAAPVFEGGFRPRAPVDEPLHLDPDEAVGVAPGERLVQRAASAVGGNGISVCPMWHPTQRAVVPGRPKFMPATCAAPPCKSAVFGGLVTGTDSPPGPACGAARTAGCSPGRWGRAPTHPGRPAARATATASCTGCWSPASP